MKHHLHGVDASDHAYGSGGFGEWIEDAFGLPAYRYTCDQRRDPKAVTPVNPIWRSPTDHSHQVGNDRLVAVASNYGYVQVRQDEGSPKYPGQTFFDEKIFQGDISGTPFGSGRNWKDFLVMNMHPHAWSIYAIPKLLGVKFTPEGVELSPSLPKEAYRFESPLLGLEKMAGGYTGWYAPRRAGKWQITLRLPDGEWAQYTHLEVNGEEQPLSRLVDGAFVWTGESTPGQPLRWSIK